MGGENPISNLGTKRLSQLPTFLSSYLCFGTPINHSKPKRLTWTVARLWWWAHIFLSFFLKWVYLSFRLGMYLKSGPEPSILDDLWFVNVVVKISENWILVLMKFNLRREYLENILQVSWRSFRPFHRQGFWNTSSIVFVQFHSFPRRFIHYQSG